jgi:preprotein translocase subunit SecA
LTHDELRAQPLLKKNKMNRAGIDAKIAALKVEVEGIEDIDKKSSDEEMDALEKEAMRYLKDATRHSS